MLLKTMPILFKFFRFKVKLLKQFLLFFLKKRVAHAFFFFMFLGLFNTAILCTYKNKKKSEVFVLFSNKKIKRVFSILLTAKKVLT